MGDFNRLESEIEYIRRKYEYYVDGASTIRDVEFDDLECVLTDAGSGIVEMVDFDIDVVVSFCEFNGLDLSTVLPSYKEVSDKNKYPHLTPMLSLQKIQVNDECDMPVDSFNLFSSRVDSCTVEGSGKYDGSSMENVYDFSPEHVGYLLGQSLTRGDKKRGLDKTSKMKFIVPTFIPGRIEGVTTIEVRGEVVMDKQVFATKYADVAANPRNTVAGILNRDEVDPAGMNDLTFVAYNLVYVDRVTGKVTSPDNSMELLVQYGFNRKYVPPVKVVPNNWDGFMELYGFFKKYKSECRFLLDGMVIKFPERYRVKMGNNGHHPYHSIAIKFPSNEAVTTINGYSFTLGKDGHITPVAELEPVELDGTRVSRATISNIGILYNRGLFVGARVSIKKSGEIIPFITGLVERSPLHDEYKALFEELYINGR